MSEDVQFDDTLGGNSDSLPIKLTPVHKPSLFVRWLLKTGIIKQEEQAIYIFLIVAFFCILGAAFIFYKSYREGPFRPQSPYELPPQKNQ